MIYKNNGNCLLEYVLLYLSEISFHGSQVNKNIQHYPGTWCFFDLYSTEPKDQIFAVLYSIIGLLVIIVTGIGNIAVMAVMLRMRRVSNNISKSSSGRTVKNAQSEMHMILFLAAIIIVFGICYSPLMVSLILPFTESVVTWLDHK